VAKQPGSLKDYAAPLPTMTVELHLPPSVVDALVERIQLAVAEVLDGQSQPPMLLTDDRLCLEVLGVSTATLRKVLLPQGLPHLLVGDQRRYDRDEVLAWLRARRDSPPT
jgi:hypothetical protein